MQRILIADAEFDVLFFPAWKVSGTEKCLFRGTVTILDLLLHLPVPVFKGVYTFCPCQLHSQAFIGVFKCFLCYIIGNPMMNHTDKVTYNTVLCSCFMEAHIPTIWRLMNWDHQSKSITCLSKKNSFYWKCNFFPDVTNALSFFGRIGFLIKKTTTTDFLNFSDFPFER